jgi:polyphosphate kinase
MQELDSSITVPLTGSAIFTLPLNPVVPASGPEIRKLKRKEYEEELAGLHMELVQLQEWVRRENKKICIAFEGRDGAGKGGVIKAITERVSPRTFRVVAL